MCTSFSLFFLTGLEAVALVRSLDLSAGLRPEDTDLVGDGLGGDRVITGNHDDLEARESSRKLSTPHKAVGNVRGIQIRVL